MYKYYLMILHIIRQEEIDMNRILVLVVIILIPIAIFTAPEAEESVSPEVLNIFLDLPVENEQDEEVQVALSVNEDKSEAFVMDLEDYVVGVVAGEMPASFSMEALKAQAVASRTFAMYKMDTISDYVLSTSINDQVYITVNEMKENWGDDFAY